MRLWEELVTSALVGTDRQPASLPTNGPLGETLGELAQKDREGALLGAAAAVSLYRRAGQVPPSAGVPREAHAPPEEAPVCSPRAAQHLEMMLGKQHRAVLPEWLGETGTRGRRVPERLLPDLLDLGRQDRDLRAAILPVLGRRGLWLAAQNPEWDYAVGGAEDDSAWETGSRAARVLVLQRIRAEDPARAREMVAGCWAKEPPEEREAFLNVFSTGLSLEDEPFLEQALDDRRKDVRAIAAELLARLPESRLCARMTERVSPLVTPRKVLFSHALEVVLPAECSKAMIRDGVEAKPGWEGKEIGEKGYWLTQMIGATPLAHWTGRSGLSVAELLQLARKDQWKRVLLGGWTQAAKRQESAEWAEALVEMAVLQPPGRSVYTLDAGLVQVLPAPRLEALALKLLDAKNEPLHDSHPVLPLIQACLHAWSPALGRIILDSIRKRIAAAGKSWDYYTREVVKQAALRVPVSLLPEAQAGWPTDSQVWDTWKPTVEEFLSILQFRHDILEEIAR